MDDIEFMLDRKISLYWKLCWFVFTPLLLIVVFFYTIATLSPVTYGKTEYPLAAHVAGSIVLAVGALQIPIWMIVAFVKNKHLPLNQVVVNVFIIILEKMNFDKNEFKKL